MNDLNWNDYFDNDRECGGEEHSVDSQVDYDNGFCGDLDDDEV